MEKMKLAIQSKLIVKSIGNIKLKELQIDSVSNLLMPIQTNINSREVAESNHTDSVSLNQISLNVPLPIIRITPMKFTDRNLSQIFNEGDLKELENIQKQNFSKTQDNTKSLFDLAKKEIQKISKAAVISIDKKEDTFNNSVTYALGVGKNFSISHTSVR